MSKEKQEDFGFMAGMPADTPVKITRNGKQHNDAGEKMNVSGSVGEYVAMRVLTQLGYRFSEFRESGPDIVSVTEDGPVNFEVKTANSTNATFDVDYVQFLENVELVEKGGSHFYVFVGYKNKRTPEVLYPTASAGVSVDSFENFVIDNIQYITIVDTRVLASADLIKRNRHFDPNEGTLHIPRKFLKQEKGDTFSVEKKEVEIKGRGDLDGVPGRMVTLRFFKQSDGKEKISTQHEPF